MDLTHHFYLPARIDAAWSAFGRLEQIAPCFPGAAVTEVDGNTYRGSVKIKFGPVPLVYQGTATIIERDSAAHRMVITADAADRRGTSNGLATVTAWFRDNGNLTEVRVDSNLALTGRPAQLGAGVVRDVSDRLLDLFVDAISARFRNGELDADPEASNTQGTVELPAVVPGEAPPVADRQPGASPAAAGAGTGQAYSWTPPGNQAAPHLNLLSAVVPSVLKRYWGVLLGGAVLAVVVARVLRRR